MPLGGTTRLNSQQYGVNQSWIGDLGKWAVGQAGDWVERRLGGGAQGGGGYDCAANGFDTDPMGNCVPRGMTVPGSDPGTALSCPGGMIRDQSGICVVQGSPGDLSTDPGGGAVIGAFGIPAMQPFLAGVLQTRNGPAPIRKCPGYAVLGKDNLCYAKGSIPRKFRKWAPSSKPPVSAYDAKMMRKYGQGGSKQARVKRLAQEAGFSCKKK